MQQGDQAMPENDDVALRAEVLERILQEPMQEGTQLAGFRNLTDTQVVRCRSLKINSESLTEIWITEAR